MGNEAIRTILDHELDRESMERCARWHPAGPGEWPAESWLIAVMGELGECAEALRGVIGQYPNSMPMLLLALMARLGDACNSFKKLERARTGTVGAPDPDEQEMLIKRISCAAEDIRQIADQFEDPEANEPAAPRPDTWDHVREESADVILYLPMLFRSLGTTWADVADKFNATSEKYGFPERLARQPALAGDAGSAGE